MSQVMRLDDRRLRLKRAAEKETALERLWRETLEGFGAELAKADKREQERFRAEHPEAAAMIAEAHSWSQGLLADYREGWLPEKRKKK
ncbi:MAG TPA: hypothetical protein VGU20_00685 [Stellaceae bacterium]|nr:hypothetical protein [Stellaceae bacterium]